jgi:hypothetical protein
LSPQKPIKKQKAPEQRHKQTTATAFFKTHFTEARRKLSEPKHPPKPKGQGCSNENTVAATMAKKESEPVCRPLAYYKNGKKTKAVR